jgi:hypothetical protein
VIRTISGSLRSTLVDLSIWDSRADISRSAHLIDEQRSGQHRHVHGSPSAVPDTPLQAMRMLDLALAMHDPDQPQQNDLIAEVQRRWNAATDQPALMWRPPWEANNSDDIHFHVDTAAVEQARQYLAAQNADLRAMGVAGGEHRAGPPVDGT